MCVGDCLLVILIILSLGVVRSHALSAMDKRSNRAGFWKAVKQSIRECGARVLRDFSGDACVSVIGIKRDLRAPDALACLVCEKG